MRLYAYYRSSTSYRVRIALNLKHCDYGIVPVDLLTAQQRSDAVRHRIGDLLACRIAADCGRRTVERHACKSSFKSYILYSCEIKGGNEMSGL